MKIRPASSFLLIDEAMERVVEVKDKAELMAYLSERYHYWEPTEDNVTVEPYGFDKRIGWDTYLVCVDGKAALYADGPLE